VGGGQIVQQLREIRTRTQRRWVVFGDSAFALDAHVQRMLKGVRARIPRGKAFNTAMARTRVANEHAFGELLSQWALVGHKRVLKLGSMPLSMHMHVAVMLRNMQVVLYGSQTELTFGGSLREPLTLQSLLARIPQ
jgi:hypothetical protein